MRRYGVGTKVVDLTKFQFRGILGRTEEIQSASIIIAQYSGIRNVSFHRQLLRDSNHTVARLVRDILEPSVSSWMLG